MEHSVNTYLRELSVGSIGYIVGYDKVFKGYQGRLLSMLIRQASQNFPIILEVKGNLIGLNKPEANALCVEEVD